MSDASGARALDLQQFAAAVAHEIRTPLTAVAGEIEVALRRDRSASEDREVLRRIAAGVAELVAISGDLALLNEPVDPARYAAASTRLDEILTPMAAKYGGTVNIRVAAGDAATLRVSGDERRLGRAMTLVVEHAMRHRRPQACVSVEAVAVPRGVRIVIDAQPSGFWPQAWTSLHAGAAEASAPLRLRTARRILDDSGATLALVGTAGSDVVHIDLRASV